MVSLLRLSGEDEGDTFPCLLMDGCAPMKGDDGHGPQVP